MFRLDSGRQGRQFFRATRGLSPVMFFRFLNNFRMTFLFLRFACGHRRIHQLIFFLGHLGSPMVFKRVRENIRSVAPSARSNDGFVFEVCVREPPYPAADCFLLGHLGSSMVFRRARENIRGVAPSGRSNDGFVFEVDVRAPPYPPR